MNRKEDMIIEAEDPKCRVIVNASTFRKEVFTLSDISKMASVGMTCCGKLVRVGDVAGKVRWWFRHGQPIKAEVVDTFDLRSFVNIPGVGWLQMERDSVA